MTTLIVTGWTGRPVMLTREHLSILFPELGECAYVVATDNISSGKRPQIAYL